MLGLSEGGDSKEMVTEGASVDVTGDLDAVGKLVEVWSEVSEVGVGYEVWETDSVEE